MEAKIAATVPKKANIIINAIEMVEWTDIGYGAPRTIIKHLEPALKIVFFPVASLKGF